MKTCCPACSPCFDAWTSPCRAPAPTPQAFPGRFKPRPQSLQLPWTGPTFSGNLPLPPHLQSNMMAQPLHGSGGELGTSRLLLCAPSPGRWAVVYSECEQWVAKDCWGGSYRLSPLPSLAQDGPASFRRLCFCPPLEQRPAAHTQAASCVRSVVMAS